MVSRVEKAVELKRNGYNCAMAVACTYCDLLGMDENTARAVTAGLGSGIGGTMEGTCGAVNAAAIMAGLKNRNAERMQAAKDSRFIAGEFKKRNGSIICRELKGVGTGVVLRSCDDCVRDAAEFLEQILGDTQD